MLRVVHVITKLELGGAQLNTLFTVEHLNREQFDTFLVSGPGGMLAPSASFAERLRIAPRLQRPIRPIQDFLAFRQLRRILKNLQPDIVHTHSSKAGILGRLAARSAHVPVIIHSVHGFSYSPRQPLWKRTLFCGLEKLVSHLTSHFIFVARADSETARRQRLVKDNFSLIRSGFPLRRFSTAATDDDIGQARRAYQLERYHFVCGMIAPFKPQKGLFHLIAIAERVIRQHPTAIFIVAGDGELRGGFEAELKRRGLFQNFRLPGFVREVEKVIDCCDIGVSTALWEGLPQSLVQLRLKKKPVVASDIPGNREVIRDGLNGFLVAVDDHRRFSERILELLNNPPLRRQLAEFDKEDFSEWEAEHMVRQQEALYLRLVGLKNLSRG